MTGIGPKKTNGPQNTVKQLLKTLSGAFIGRVWTIPLMRSPAPMVLEMIRAIEGKDSFEIASKTLQQIAAVFRLRFKPGGRLLTRRQICAEHSR